MSRLALCAALLSLSLQAVAASELLSLNYRMADEMLPLAESIIGTQGSVKAHGNHLLVTAPSAKIEELKSLLSQLDQAPKRLRISVDTRGDNQQTDQGYQVDGTLSGGHVQIQSGHGEQHGRDQVRIIRRSTDSRSGGIQQIQANEGYPALIQIGQSVPLSNVSVGPYGQVYQQTQYRDINQGFYVTANLIGERVQLKISTQNDRLNPYQPGVIDTQSSDTQVTGSLGQWIQIGGVSQQYDEQSSGFARRHSTQGYHDSQIRIKVERLD